MLIVIEAAAVLFTFLYLYFIGKQQAIGWLMGVIASALSVYFFYVKGFYGSASLNFIYIFQGLVGFYYWKKVEFKKPVRYYFTRAQHIIVFISIVVLFIILKWILKQYGIVDLKELDILLSGGCMVATYLEIKKDTSCWWYWMVLNTLFAIYYFKEGVIIYALLMVVLAFFSYWAFKQWRLKELSVKAVD